MSFIFIIFIIIAMSDKKSRDFLSRLTKEIVSQVRGQAPSPDKKEYSFPVEKKSTTIAKPSTIRPANTSAISNAHMEDESGDWLSTQLEYERRAAQRFNSEFGGTHDYCDAAALKREHEQIHGMM